MDHAAPGFERVDRDGVPTLVVSGEIDLACADELRTHLHAITPVGAPVGTASAGAATTSTVVVDLSGVTFLDSSGLGVLIAAKKRAIATDADLALEAPSPACRSVLELSGADKFFEIRDSS